MEYRIASPIGTLAIEADPEGIRAIRMTKARVSAAPVPPAFRQAVREVQEYFTGKRRDFTVRADPGGTPFQRRVWKALQRVSFGATVTYAELARRAGSPKASRAVGAAMAKNPLLLVTPCHRVVAANGLGGFSCGLAKKRWLLKHEGIA